jgi:N utilization substance protein A
VVETELKTKEFRRLSAGAAKSVIIQAIREGERNAMQQAYESKREEIITATVSKIDPVNGNVVLETDNGRAVLLKSEQIPGESFYVDQKIKVFVMEVNKETRGPLVTLSRVHPGLVRRMFELEVPEIQDGIVLVKGVAREAGSRTKIAVWSRDEDVDAVGACIGAHGMRIGGIVEELNGEKIDIVKYSETPEEFVAAALAPATVESVTFTAERACRVVVDADQLSLAIGKEGQNARLAARLTGMKIDIKSE